MVLAEAIISPSLSYAIERGMSNSSSWIYKTVRDMGSHRYNKHRTDTQLDSVFPSNLSEMPCNPCATPGSNAPGWFVVPAFANVKITSERDCLAQQDTVAASVSSASPFNVDLYVRNLGGKQRKFMDVSESRVPDGTPIISWTLNTPRTGNQLVRL